MISLLKVDYTNELNKLYITVIMLRYKIIKQQNALDENKSEMYYPRLTGRQKYKYNELASYISDRTTLSKADIGATLIALEEAIPYLLKSGFSIKLGDLGTFSLEAKAHSSSKEEDVSSRDFYQLNTRFRVGKALKLLLHEVNFKRV